MWAAVSERYYSAGLSLRCCAYSLEMLTATSDHKNYLLSSHKSATVVISQKTYGRYGQESEALETLM